MAERFWQSNKIFKQLFEKFELVFIKVQTSMTKSKNFNNLTKVINDHR